MARIRSLHPGMFTDEAYMSLSMTAKAAWPGLWTECDDYGIFEWKPMVLKARLFPADNVDFPAVLAELEQSDCVRRFEVDGKPYGAVRNFGKYQSPKKPLGRHPRPEWWGSYVGSRRPSSEPVPNQSGTSPEVSLQREDGEGIGIGESKKEGADAGARLAPKRDKKPQKRASHPLPDRYQLSEGAWAYARTKGLTDTEIRREFERFKNAARATDRRCVDWESAWRNWVLKALEFLGRAPADTEPIDVSGFYAEAESDELRAWDEFKRRENGRGCPRDSRGGWLVPSQWPPGREQGKAA